MRIAQFAIAVLMLAVAAIHGSQLNVDYMAAPDTIAGLFEESEAVLLVRVVGAREVTGRSPIHSRSQYPVLVVEKFKGDGSIPSKGPGFTVVRRGGLSADQAEVGFEQFKAGDEYVLFLRYNRELEGYTVAYGPSGAIRIDPGGTAKALGPAKATRSFTGRPTEDLLTTLREFAK